MILAFDGVCVLCNGFVDFLIRRDPHRRLRFASSTTPAGAAIFAATGQDAAYPVSVILIDGQRRYVQSAAIIRTVEQLGGRWRAVGLLRAVPAIVRDAIYGWVARRRYGWFGRLDACPVPTGATADRFLA